MIMLALSRDRTSNLRETRLLLTSRHDSEKYKYNGKRFFSMLWVSSKSKKNHLAHDNHKGSVA
jgi:hypothetical protein